MLRLLIAPRHLPPRLPLPPRRPSRWAVDALSVLGGAWGRAGGRRRDGLGAVTCLPNPCEPIPHGARGWERRPGAFAQASGVFEAGAGAAREPSARLGISVPHLRQRGARLTSVPQAPQN